MTSLWAGLAAKASVGAHVLIGAIKITGHGLLSIPGVAVRIEDKGPA
jgi:hypothetical protein